MTVSKTPFFQGDTPADNIKDPFHLHIKEELRAWLAQESLSLALTTYEGGKLIVIGSGREGGTTVSERNFERCMAMHVEGSGEIWISTNHCVWRLENALNKGQNLNEWDSVYIPRTAHVTGCIDIHDLVIANEDHLFGVITAYNCIARLNPVRIGSFEPFWSPPFISGIYSEDRCHLNGFCTGENGNLLYATMVSQTNEDTAWRDHRKNGGTIINIQTNDVVATGLSMPHTPRLYKGQLWVLEAGSGWLCHVDVQTGEFERVLWRPGFLRGLRFYKNYAFICSSMPRDQYFHGLPLDNILKERGETARCAVDIIDMETMNIVHSLEITGAVKEIYDVALLENCKQPLLYGIQGEEARRIVVVGDSSV